jgi:hypothetical protein
MSADEQQHLVRYVHEGHVLRPAGQLKVCISIDPVSISRVEALLEQARRSLIGVAIPLIRAPDEEHIIDQD